MGLDKEKKVAPEDINVPLAELGRLWLEKSKLIQRMNQLDARAIELARFIEQHNGDGSHDSGGVCTASE